MLKIDLVCFKKAYFKDPTCLSFSPLDVTEAGLRKVGDYWRDGCVNHNNLNNNFKFIKPMSILFKAVTKKHFVARYGYRQPILTDGLVL